MAALFRQSPLNAIWEGSGNVICLDVLRACSREPESAVAFFAELDRASAAADAAGAPANSYAATVRSLQRTLTEASASPERMQALQFGARGLVDRLAVCLQAATLLQYGDEGVARAFLATRLPPTAEGGAGEGYLPVHCMGAVTGSTLDEEVVSHLLERLHMATV